MKKSLSLSLFFAIALAAASDLSATSIVVNGGFETGDFTGWTVSTTSDLPWAIDTSVSGSGSGHGPNSLHRQRYAIDDRLSLPGFDNRGR